MNTDGHCIICGTPTERLRSTYCAAHGQRARIVVLDYDPSSPWRTPMETPCRTWRGALCRSGYGMRHHIGVHRWVWQQAFGPIPKGMVIMHLCDNPPCYRLDHLQLGTIAENNADRDRKGRYNLRGKTRGIRGDLHPNTKLNRASVAEIRARLAGGETITVLAREFGVSWAAIGLIRRDATWRYADAGWTGESDRHGAR